MKKRILSILCLILVASMVMACTDDTSSDVSSDSSVVSETSGVVTESSDVSSTVESEVSSAVESQVSSAPVSSIVTPSSSNVSSEPDPVSEPDDLDPNQKVEQAIADRDDGAAPKTKVVNGKTYNLTFEDTFKGDELDSSKWDYCREEPRQDMGGYWDDSMTEVHDGALVLWAEMDDHPISGAIQSKFTQNKGYFEAKIKMPKPPMCYWGAFWMMCGNMSSGAVPGGKDGIEIDIFETIPNRSWQVQHNMHWDGYGNSHKQTGAFYTGGLQGVYNGGWHTYAVEWTDTYYKFYIDDQCTLTVDENHKSWEELKGTCTAKGYMLLTIEFGKSTGYNSVQENQLPGYMLVDWVRVYK